MLTVGLGGCSDAADEHPSFASPAEAAGAGAGGASVVDLGVGRGSAGGVDSLNGCAHVGKTATSTFRPIDVIFVIDNSSSMDDEIAEVQARLNDDFARIIADSGLDYRVILISRYGQVGIPVGDSDNPICIGTPLGGSACSDPLATPLAHGERFFHYSAAVGSHDAWCTLLGAFDQGDEYGDLPRPGWSSLAARGYEQYLRKGAFKTVVVITDDDVSCEVEGKTFTDNTSVGGGEKAAAAFDTAMLELSPEQFGSSERRNYVFHSIVGLAANTADARAAWPATAPMQMGRCDAGSEGPGTGYQALSRLTGGLRYPSCQSKDFDAVFNAIAEGIVGRAELDCAWAIPAPPAGQRFDPARVNVRYTRAAGSAEQILNVTGAEACGGLGGWYYDESSRPTRVIACPNTCDHIQRDPWGRIDVLFGCETQTQIR